MGDVRRSDFRQAVWLVAYVSLAVSSIVLGDFSTALEMTGASKRFEERGLRFEEYGDNPEREPLDGQSSDDQMTQDRIEI